METEVIAELKYHDFRKSWEEYRKHLTGEVKERLEYMSTPVASKSDGNVTVVVMVQGGMAGLVMNHSIRGLFDSGMLVNHPGFLDYANGRMLNLLCAVDKDNGLIPLSVGPSKKTPSDYGDIRPTGKILNLKIDDAKTRKETSVSEVNEVKDETTSGYYINAEARLVFTSAKALSDARPERAVKLMMVGASGYGKTTLPKVFSERIGYSFMRMNCANIRDPEEWFGYREAIEGSTVFIRSQFTKAIEAGNLVVVLDEFNRLEPWLHNTLFPLLDDDGCTVVHDEEFRIGQNVIVVGTINTGYRYTGTFELDEALYNRFNFVLEVGAMPHSEEVKVLMNRTGVEKNDANEIVKMATRLRTMNVVCSTRSTLDIALMVSIGMTKREAFETAVVKRIPADNAGVNLRKQAVDAINVNIGVLTERRVTGDVFDGDDFLSPEVTGEVHTVTYKLFNNGKPFQLALAIASLRKLPTYGGDMSQKEAYRIANDVRNKIPVELTLVSNDFPLVQADLASAGIGVTIDA